MADIRVPAVRLSRSRSFFRDSGFAQPELEKWLRLNAEYAKVWPNITMKKPPPPDSKDWEGKLDKFQYFSPNPGAGD
jgi:Domain of unknown function (DUF3470)